MNVFEIFAKISIDDSDFGLKIGKAKTDFEALDTAAENAAKGTDKAQSSFDNFGDSAEGAGESAEEAASSTDTLANKIKMIEGLYEKAQAEVERLSRAFNESADKTGAASDETVALAAQLAKAEKAAETYSNALDEVDRELKNTESASEGASGGLEGLIGKMQGAIIKGQLMAKAIEGAIGILIDVAQWVFTLDSATEDYRAAQGKLNTAFESAGYSVDAAAKTYQGFYEILGDTDTATEASQLLAKLSNNQEDLSTWTKISAGVYGTFGDSLPINGLIEAANETAKVGQVTGVLADALNWAGISEDEFNMQLAACSTESERNKLIMDALNATYSDAANTFYENNEQLIQHRRNQASLQESTAKLGEAMGRLKDNVIAKLAPYLESAMEKGVAFIEKLDKAIQETGLADTLGRILDAVAGLLDPLGTIIEAILPAANAVLEPAIWLINGVAGALDWLLDTVNAAVSLLTGNQSKFEQALGLDPNNPSNLQKWMNRVYGNSEDEGKSLRPGETWDGKIIDEFGKEWNSHADNYFSDQYVGISRPWLSDGSAASVTNNYEVNIDAKSVQDFNDIVRISQNQRIATRMGVS